MIQVAGTGVSPGIALGKVLVYQNDLPTVTMEPVAENQIEQELLRYRDALNRTEEELRLRLAVLSDQAEQAILSAQLELLRDPSVQEEITALISEQRYHGDRAADQAFEQAATMLEECGDALLAERAADLRDVKLRLLRKYAGVESHSLERLDRPMILAARDLLPSETAGLDRTNVLGILTEVGGATSHVAILAKSYGIPAVLGVPGLMDVVRDGTQAALDGSTGEVVVEPHSQTQQEFLERQEHYLQEEALTAAFADKPSQTADGAPVQLGANLGSVDQSELDGAAKADFVGLFRTEFLYMNSNHMPTEEEQFQAYKKVLMTFAPRPVTLRTLDIGGDKELPYLNLPHEENPFLGCRAFRFCLEHLDILRTQLRAALRASVFGTLWLMIPMIGSLDDIRTARTFLEQMKQELDQEGVPRGKNVKFGIMVEVPSIALMADLAAKEVDFASIGTNDLCQYLTASDRGNPLVSQYYQSYHPALFRCLGEVARQFALAHKPLSVCGELGGDLLAAPVLAGLGIRKLSMAPASFSRIKRNLSLYSIEELRKLSSNVCQLSTAAEVKDLLHQRFQA